MKLYIYIIDADAFLRGDYGWSLKASDRPDIKATGYFLAGDVEVNLNVVNQTVTQFALDTIDKAEQQEIAEHQVKMDMLKEKKANLLSITHTTEQPEI